jgi:hypothetical protein
MRLPRVRLTIGSLMSFIAILALLFAGGKWAVEWVVERFGQPVPLPHYEPYHPTKVPTPVIGRASEADECP